MERKEEEKIQYKKIELGMFENYHRGCNRLFKEYDIKLKNCESTLAKKTSNCLELTKNFTDTAHNTRQFIQDLSKYSESDAFQALGCLINAFENPSPEHLEQLQLLINDLNKVSEENIINTAFYQRLKAVAYGVGAVVFLLSCITIAIMFPPSAPVVLIAAGVVSPALALTGVIKYSAGTKTALDAKGLASSSKALADSMRELKQGLTEGEKLNKDGMTPEWLEEENKKKDDDEDGPSWLKKDV